MDDGWIDCSPVSRSIDCLLDRKTFRSVDLGRLFYSTTDPIDMRSGHSKIKAIHVTLLHSEQKCRVEHKAAATYDVRRLHPDSWCTRCLVWKTFREEDDFYLELKEYVGGGTTVRKLGTFIEACRWRRLVFWSQDLFAMDFLSFVRSSGTKVSPATVLSGQLIDLTYLYFG